MGDCFHRGTKAIHHRDTEGAEAGKMCAALSTMNSSYSNAVFTSLRTLRLCGGSTGFPNSLAHSERSCKTATRNGNRCGNRSGNRSGKRRGSEKRGAGSEEQGARSREREAGIESAEQRATYRPGRQFPGGRLEYRRKRRRLDKHRPNRKCKFKEASPLKPKPETRKGAKGQMFLLS